MGTFTCADCGVVTKNVEQEFKYTQVSITTREIFDISNYLSGSYSFLFQPTKCSNAQCANRTRFDLNIDESSFVDFQKIRIQVRFS